MKPARIIPSAWPARQDIHPDCRERFLPLSGAWALPLASRGVTLAGISDLRTGYGIARPEPRFHVLIFTLAGMGRVEVGQPEAEARARGGRSPSRFHEAVPGTALLLTSPWPHAYRLAGRRWRILWLHLRASAGPWARLSGMPWSLAPAVADIRAIEASAEGLLREAGGLALAGPPALAAAAPDSAKAARLHAEMLSLQLGRELTGRVGTAGAPGSSDHYLFARLRQALAEVDASLHLPWTIAMLAKRAAMSPAHLHRVALRFQGEPPLRLVARLRIARAEALLASTDLPAYAVSEQVGFTNPYAFSTAFRRATGESPSQYRATRRDASR